MCVFVSQCWFESEPSFMKWTNLVSWNFSSFILHQCTIWRVLVSKKIYLQFLFKIWRMLQQRLSTHEWSQNEQIRVSKHLHIFVCSTVCSEHACREYIFLTSLSLLTPPDRCWWWWLSTFNILYHWLLDWRWRISHGTCPIVTHSTPVKEMTVILSIKIADMLSVLSGGNESWLSQGVNYQSRLLLLNCCTPVKKRFSVKKLKKKLWVLNKL